MRHFRIIRAFFAGIAMLLLTSGVGQAQYFTVERPTQLVLEANGRDSVLLQSMTPFAVPEVNDTFPIVYHEPMPDSIMPQSAIVIGWVTIQAEEAEDVAALIEQYARKLGADWIVSFQEPKAALDASHWKVYRSKALLLRVLDDRFIAESAIEYSYYDQNHLQNYNEVMRWFGDRR